MFAVLFCRLFRLVWRRLGILLVHLELEVPHRFGGEDDSADGHDVLDPARVGGVCHDVLVAALFLSTWLGTHASTMSRDVPDIHGDQADFCQC